MHASQSPRSLAVNVAVLAGLLAVVIFSSPAQSDSRVPDRVVVDHTAMVDLGVSELHVFEGDPMRIELVADGAGVVAAVFVYEAGRGIYGDFQRAHTTEAASFYAARSAEAPRAMLNAILHDRDLLGLSAGIPQNLLVSSR